MIEERIDKVNRSWPRSRRMAGAQIQRFLILHKELDADDGELTRTQKVRRGFIADRYAPLVEALYDGAREASIATEVTFEDGRKGTVAREHRRSSTWSPFPRQPRRKHARHERRRRILLSVENVSLSFGGVRAICRRLASISASGEIRAIIGPNGAGKTSMLNVINGFYHPQQGTITFAGETRARDEPARSRRAGHRPHLPERRAVQGHDRARQHHDGAQPAR